MNVKITPWRILVAVLIGTLIGPLTMVKEMGTPDMVAANFWVEVLALTAKSGAASVLSVFTLLAGLMNIPEIWKKAANVEPPANP